MFKKSKIITLVAVLAAITVSISSLTACSFADNKSEIIPVKSEVKNGTKTIVYYFYAKPRCVSCKKIESYTKETVSSLNNPKVEFKTVDLDQPENKHYAKDYKLYTKSVVLSKVKNGKEVKSKNLSEIWTKLGDKKSFKNYVTKEIKSF